MYNFNVYNTDGFYVHFAYGWHPHCGDAVIELFPGGDAVIELFPGKMNKDDLISNRKLRDTGLLKISIVKQ